MQFLYGQNSSAFVFIQNNDFLTFCSLGVNYSMHSCYMLVRFSKVCAFVVCLFSLLNQHYYVYFNKHCISY